jgi:hypothetical protein
VGGVRDETAETIFDGLLNVGPLQDAPEPLGRHVEEPCAVAGVENEQVTHIVDSRLILEMALGRALTCCWRE